MREFGYPLKWQISDIDLAVLFNLGHDVIKWSSEPEPELNFTEGYYTFGIDDDDLINPLTDGLIVASAALAIEVAAGDELAPATFDSNIIDQVMNPEGVRSETALVKNHLQELVTNESLDHNGNQMLDIHDAEYFIRSSMGTYLGQALTTGGCAEPTKLIGIEEQLTVIDQSQFLA